IPFGILVLLSFLFSSKLAAPQKRFILWFSAGQLPLLFASTFVHLLLDKRYAMSASLVLAIAPAFLFAQAIRDWSVHRLAKPFLIAATLAIAAAWLIGVPKPSRLTYLKTAGEW